MPRFCPLGQQPTCDIQTNRIILSLYLSPQAEADAEAYSIITAAKAVAQRTRIEAEAHAHATRLAAEAEAEATRIKAGADAAVEDPFAQEMGRRRQEVRRVAAYGNKAVFVPTEAMGVAGPALTGLAAGMGADLRK